MLGNAFALFVLLSAPRRLALVPTSFAAWDFVPGPWFFAFEQAAVLSLLYSLAAAISAWRLAAAGTVARVRAKAYAIAFVTRDARLIAFIVAVNVWGSGSPASDPRSPRERVRDPS